MSVYTLRWLNIVSCIVVFFFLFNFFNISFHVSRWASAYSHNGVVSEDRGSDGKNNGVIREVVEKMSTLRSSRATGISFDGGTHWNDVAWGSFHSGSRDVVFVNSSSLGKDYIYWSFPDLGINSDKVVFVNGGGILAVNKEAINMGKVIDIRLLSRKSLRFAFEKEVRFDAKRLAETMARNNDNKFYIVFIDSVNFIGGDSEIVGYQYIRN